MKVICTRCGGTNIACEAIVNPNTGKIIDYLDESFMHANCGDCKEEVVITDVDDYYLVTDGESISMAYFFKGWGKFAKYHKYPHPFYDDGVVKLYMPIPPISLALEGDRGILNIGEFKRKEIDYEQK